MTENVADLLLRPFRDFHDDVFLVDAVSDRVSTYGQVWTRAASLAELWTRKGARPGDMVALMPPNGSDFVCCYLACLVGGFVAAPINRELPDKDIEYILEITHPRLVLREPPPETKTSAVAPTHLNTVPDSVCAVFHTSGTTGRPKGVRHSLRTLVGNVHAFNGMTGLGPHTSMYHVLPMAYMAGFLNTVLSPLVAGGRVVIGPRFKPQTALDFWSIPRRFGANTMWLTPSIAAALQRMARDPEVARDNAAGFDQVFCGTAPLYKTVRQAFLDTFGVPLQESYGSSELLLISGQIRDDVPGHADVGHPLPGLELDVRPDAEGNPELTVRSPFAYLGYLTADGSGMEAPMPDSFVRTGDAGELRDGRLVITGRLKDLIIRGGVNVAPIALENALGDLPGVSDIAVIGLSHLFWGESIVVCLEAKSGADYDALVEQAQRVARERLARSQWPDRVEVLDAFPRAANGKVRKSVLRAELGR